MSTDHAAPPEGVVHDDEANHDRRQHDELMSDAGDQSDPSAMEESAPAPGTASEPASAEVEPEVRVVAAVLDEPSDDAPGSESSTPEPPGIEPPADSEEADEPPEPVRRPRRRPIADLPPIEPIAPTADDMRWYVLKVQSNREKSIRESLQRRIRRDGLEPYFGQIVIPTEKRQETKGGKKRVVEHKLYPGYIMIQMVLNDETWYLVRDTGGVGDFTGASGKPLPMEQADIDRMLKPQDPDQPEVVKVKIAYATGDTVKIKEGPFESFEGTINSIDEASGKVSVLIEIFGRSTPVDLEYWQVERV